VSMRRQPKGIPTGGRFAAEQRAESNLFTQEVPPMEPMTGRLSESAAPTLTAAGARGAWYGAQQMDDNNFSRASTAMRNLAKNKATPPDVLHEMFVAPAKDGTNQLVDAPLGYIDQDEAMQAAIQNPNIAAETLFVIAWGNGPEGSADAARKKLKERRRSSWRERFNLIGARRRADTIRPEQLKPKN
jgi:hypothetical protein